MNLTDIITRTPPIAWSEGDNIPWNEPSFSERMLKEHLSQEHDAASRRNEQIERHVAWIQHALLHDAQSKVLDLGCGPGLYANRLARLGNTCYGVDFSPASIQYARETAQRENLDCTYNLCDLRTAEFGQGYDLGMFIYGEFNVFRPEHTRLILNKLHAALKPGARLLLEISTFEATRRIGTGSASWYSSPSGLFSAQPYLCLEEAAWDEASRTSTTRYLIIDAASAAVSRFGASYQAYTDAEIETLLIQSGYNQVHFYPALGVEDPAAQRQDFIAITAIRI